MRSHPEYRFKLQHPNDNFQIYFNELLILLKQVPNKEFVAVLPKSYLLSTHLSVQSTCQTLKMHTNKITHELFITSCLEGLDKSQAHLKAISKAKEEHVSCSKTDLFFCFIVTYCPNNIIVKSLGILVIRKVIFCCGLFFCS